jgi:hypothetical protein
MYKFEKISRCIINEIEASHRFISIRLYFILAILITKRDRNYLILMIAISTQLLGEVSHNIIIIDFVFTTYNKMKKKIYHCRNSSNFK